MITRGLYVHVPYCVRKCNYCDFCSLGGGAVPDGYIDALLREAERYSKKESLLFDSIYIGGGTPSLLSVRQLERLLSGLGKRFSVTPDCEITLEANPGTLTAEKPGGYKSLGVNRISLGLQSIHENELKILGRIHDYKEFLSSYEAVRRAGFDNVNVDVMYGIPKQTKESFAETLSELARLSPEHISAYGLILEEGTPLYSERDTLALPTEDEECDMYSFACEFLRSRGYSHYEISNYAREGRQSRHNLKYWRDEEYIGLGAAAYSYFGGKRYGNCRDVAAYIRGEEICSDCEDIDAEGEAYEYVMMRLRLKEGFSLSDYERRFSRDFLSGREERLRELSRGGYLTYENGRIAFTEKGFYVSNTLICELL